jgi:peptidyl-prolyl cis-trans isomerase D
VISQAVVPDRAAADAIAARARGGASFVAATAPAGLSAADISVGPQTRAEFASLAGDRVAAAAFAAAAGAIVGPVQSDLGWHVVKIDSVRRQGGKTLDQARAEIAARLTAEKRKEALTDLVTRVEDAISEGSNFEEAARQAKLPVSQTPLITGAGVARTDASFRFPAELAPALKSGFELAPSDEPVVETLPGEAGFVMVAPAQVVPAAPAPLASIEDRVAADWVNAQATQRAQQAASSIATAAGKNVPLKQAANATRANATVRDVQLRRIDLTQMQGQVPPAVRMLFNLGQGKSRMVADPAGKGFYVVKVNRITPGNAVTQPGLISQLQNDFQRGTSEEYAQQFLRAIRESLGVKRNEQAIATSRRQILGS